MLKVQQKVGKLDQLFPLRPGPLAGLWSFGAQYAAQSQFPHPQRGLERDITKPQEVPCFLSAHPTRGSLGHAEMAVAILSLSQQASAKQHQKAGLRTQCSPAKPPTALALDVKWALSHLAHKNQE